MDETRREQTEVRYQRYGTKLIRSLPCSYPVFWWPAPVPAIQVFPARFLSFHADSKRSSALPAHSRVVPSRRSDLNRNTCTCTVLVKRPCGEFCDVPRMIPAAFPFTTLAGHIFARSPARTCVLVACHNSTVLHIRTLFSVTHRDELGFTPQVVVVQSIYL